MQLDQAQHHLQPGQSFAFLGPNLASLVMAVWEHIVFECSDGSFPPFAGTMQTYSVGAIQSIGTTGLVTILGKDARKRLASAII